MLEFGVGWVRNCAVVFLVGLARHYCCELKSFLFFFDKGFVEFLYRSWIFGVEMKICKGK